MPLTARISSVFLNSAIGVHEAGQHVDIRLTAPDGYQAQRSYSIASAPGAPHIELAIEKLDDGEVSPYFFEVAQPGDGFELRGPIGGHFVWRHVDGGPLLLVAGGSGIAPIVSIVRHWAASSCEDPVTLVYSVRTWDDLAFGAELLALEQASPAFRLVVTTTRGARTRSRDFERRLDRAMVHEVLAHSSKAAYRTYVCGSTPFVEAAAASLVDEGVLAETIRTERFGGMGA